MLCPAHHHDGGDYIVFFIAARDSEPWNVSDIDSRDILHLHRNTIELAQDHFFDVINLVAFGEIIIASAIDQADATDVDRLLADSGSHALRH